MSLKDISYFFGILSLQSVDTTQPDVNFIHHTFEILNDGVKSLSYGVKPLHDQSEIISLYSSISKHLLIGIVIFSWNMPAALQKRENQAILWYACAATTNLYSKVLILLVNATNDTYSLYKLMLSFLWERNKCFVTAIKPRYQMLFLWEEKTQTSPSYLGFELPIRVSLSRKTLPIALSVARIMCVLLYFSFVVHNT